MQIFARDKRLLVSIGFLILAVCMFWFGSRYPALNAKAMMGDRVEMSGIAFDTLIETLPGTGTLKTIAINTVNWIYTNWKGMTFGVIFGAALLTILGLLPKRQFKGYFSNALMGTMMGAPLGVCVNCAAPIAQGLHEVGMRRETTLAALIASPSLNVIVVTMSFSLLPFHLAMIKVLAILVFLLVVIPVFVRYLDQRERRDAAAVELPDVSAKLQENSLLRAVGEQIHTGTHMERDKANFGRAFLWFARNYLKNLWLIARITVPLMLVAGILGAVFITVIPFGSLLALISPFDGPAGTIVTLCLVAAFALILPVPIAFDVMFVSVLLSAGWRDHHAMAALLALGSFSIYSYMIIGRAMSFKLASALSALLFGMSVLTGIVAFFVQPNMFETRWTQVETLLTTAQPREIVLGPDPLALSPKDIAAQKSGFAVSHEPLTSTIVHDGAGTVTATHVALTSKNRVGADTPFARLTGDQIGLDITHRNGTLKQLEPYVYFGGIAAGDIDGDGWDEIVMGGDPETGGLVLYTNIGGQFARQVFDQGPIVDAYVNSVALVDLNNDRALDLVATTYMNGAYVFWNRAGAFDTTPPMRLPNGDAIMIGATGFADLDGDGDLDIVAGNWVAGTTTRFAADHRATDHILWNEGGTFQPAPLPGVPGQTLSVLIMDVDGNGLDDIIVGDDSSDSDKVYLNQGQRAFRLLRKSDGLLPYLGQATMSLDSGDFDNDLRPDLYLSQITEPDTGAHTPYCSPQMQALHGETKRCESNQFDRGELFRSSNPALPDCYKMRNAEMRTLCAINTKLRNAGTFDAPMDCTNIPEGWTQLRQVCETITPFQTLTPDEIAADNAANDPLGFFAVRSLLFQATDAGGYTDIAADGQAARPGWSWNARFTDLDQDGRQDIFVATGFISLPPYASNAYYRNTPDKGFQYASPMFGLDDAIPTSSYVLLDYDRDGDVDVIRAPTTSKALVHRNDAPAGSALWVKLRDTIGNAHGVGARIVIETADGQQMRDIKASGGFASFDVMQAHFGLGDAETVNAIVVNWQDGSTTRIAGPVLAGSEVVIARD